MPKTSGPSRTPSTTSRSTARSSGTNGEGMEAAAAELADRLGLHFADVGLLAQALVHSSYTNEQAGPARSNDRLEFLGDAVVALVISQDLFARHPDADEGELTTRRAAIVSARGLATAANRLGLGDYVVLGHGASVAGERARNSILAGAFEAVTGAIYTEQGLEATRRWLLDVFTPELEADLPLQDLKAPKSKLQELAYAQTGRPPHYKMVSSEGPQHDRVYEVEVSIGARALGRGSGRNRRGAETAAAEEALELLKQESGSRLGRARDGACPADRPARARLQVVCRANHSRIRSGDQCRDRPQRERQEQLGRRPPLDVGRGRTLLADAPCRGRDLRRVIGAPRDGHGRRNARARELGSPAAGRLRAGRAGTAALSIRPKRVPAQSAAHPPARSDRPARRGQPGRQRFPVHRSGHGRPGARAAARRAAAAVRGGGRRATPRASAASGRERAG